MSIYVHIPFCTSRCIYCGFYSTTDMRLQERYVDALISELNMRRDFIKDNKISTLYLGGGTPSTLPTPLLDRLLSAITDAYPLADGAEVTMECNPDDITPDFARWIGRSMINRVSMGVQTFNPERLRWLHRRHTPEQVCDAVRMLRDNGISNISLDLIFGFPGQTLAEWEDDLHKLLTLTPQHISAYSLMYEEGTPLGVMLDKGLVNEISDEVSLSMYTTLIDTLTAAGYEHYEISNFALPDMRSRHNSNYWNETPYLGLGAAAHSYNKCTRAWNIDNLHNYLSAIESGTLPLEIEPIDERTRYNDIITTALRTREGIDLNTLSEDYQQYIKREAASDLSAGNLIFDGQHLHLSRKGLFISDLVMEKLISLR